ncbi:hypothetical protein MRX96_033303 [Rhipicephalus microplus]
MAGVLSKASGDCDRSWRGSPPRPPCGRSLGAGCSALGFTACQTVDVAARLIHPPSRRRSSRTHRTATRTSWTCSTVAQRGDAASREGSDTRASTTRSWSAPNPLHVGMVVDDEKMLLKHQQTSVSPAVVPRHYESIVNAGSSIIYCSARGDPDEPGAGQPSIHMPVNSGSQASNEEHCHSPDGVEGGPPGA